MAAVLATVSMAVWGPGSATAGSTGVTLTYTCTLPPFPSQPTVAQVTWNAPNSVMVGQATPPVTVDASATGGPAVTALLGVDGAATVEGSADAPGTVIAPEGTIPSALELIVPRTVVPASGPIVVHATGTAPRLVFRQPGHATINLGSAMTLHVTLRNSGGNPAAVGAVDVSCTLDPGQNTVVVSFDITPMPAAQPATAAATTGRVPAPTVTEPQATVTPPGPTSSSSTTGSATTSTPTQPVVTTATTPPAAAVRASSRAVDPRRAMVGWWLAAAIILAAAAGVIGGVWWHTRRRRRASRL